MLKRLARFHTKSTRSSQHPRVFQHNESSLFNSTTILPEIFLAGSRAREFKIAVSHSRYRHVKGEMTHVNVGKIATYFPLWVVEGSKQNLQVTVVMNVHCMRDFLRAAEIAPFC